MPFVLGTGHLISGGGGCVWLGAKSSMHIHMIHFHSHTCHHFYSRFRKHMIGKTSEQTFFQQVCGQFFFNKIPIKKKVIRSCPRNLLASLIFFSSDICVFLPNKFFFYEALGPMFSGCCTQDDHFLIAWIRNSPTHFSQPIRHSLNYYFWGDSIFSEPFIMDPKIEIAFFVTFFFIRPIQTFSAQK